MGDAANAGVAAAIVMIVMTVVIRTIFMAVYLSGGQVELNHKPDLLKRQPVKGVLLVAFFSGFCHSNGMDLEALFEAINDEELEPNSDLGVLREVLQSVQGRKNFDTKTMKRFGELTGKAHQHRRLKPSASEIEFELVGLSGSARRISEFALQVEDILVTVDLSRVKKCEGEGCEALFIDESKNKSRRWCDMAHCGALRKSKVYYDKHRRVNPVTDSKSTLGAKS